MTYPFVQAAHYRAGRIKTPRLIVVHDMEAPEKATTAEAVQAYFHRADSRVASTQLCCDSDSVVRCVLDSDTAFGAQGANSDGLHIEHAGYQRQSPDEWLDPFGMSMLGLSSLATAQWCRTYGIPPTRLTPAQVRAGAKGFCGHGDVTAAYPPGTGHTDPGGGFPWDYYLGLVRTHLTPPAEPAQPDQEDDMAEKIYVDGAKHYIGTATGKRPIHSTAEERAHLADGAVRSVLAAEYVRLIPNVPST